MNKAVSESLEESLCQVLGEDVSNLVLRLAVNHSDLLDLDEVTDSVVPDINVLHSLVQGWGLCSSHCSLVVLVHHSRRRHFV